MDTPTGSPAPVEKPREDRLDSWKEIASYLNRDVSTVQRWEKREGMPVHRHLHDKLGSVYALPAELEAWSQSRKLQLAGDEPAQEPVAGAPVPAAMPGVAAARERRRFVWPAIAAGAILAAGLIVWRLERTDFFWRNPIANAAFAPVTDFEGAQQAAAISRDGTFVAFLSNREGQIDVWVTQIGARRFYNLTRNSDLDLSNPSVRTLTFSPDGALIYFWARKADGSKSGDIGIWSVPTMGGEPRPYLDNVAELDWSGDSSRLVYHTPGPGDPMFVTEAHQPLPGRQIFIAPPGSHGHYPVWSPDQAFVYFVQGLVPDEMDLWRIRPGSDGAERLTFHHSRVSHPVFVNPRTLLYLATDADGAGPWLYGLDVERRVSHRLSSGFDRYQSIAASADGRRLVAALANPKATLWRVSISDTAVETSAATRIALTTAPGRSPRLGPNYMLYIASAGGSDSIWKLVDDKAAELWSAPDAQILGGPAISADGTRIAVSVRERGRTRLYAMSADGTNARVVTDALALRGAPAWAPDGQSLWLAADDRGTPRLFSVSLDGRTLTPIVAEYSAEPAWAPDGQFVVYSGPDIGTTFRVNAVTADGGAYPLPNLTLTRGARHVAFLPGRRAIVAFKGEIEHKDLWLIDLDTGAERQLTNFGRDFIVRDFDVSRDGREIVVERVQENSDVVRLDLPVR